jgi:hypothetical protein
MVVNMRKVRTIEEKVLVFDTGLRSEEGLVVRVEDWTCYLVVSTGARTPSQRRRPGTTRTL